MIELPAVVFHALACLAMGVLVLRALGAGLDEGVDDAPVAGTARMSPTGRITCAFIVGQGVLSQVLLLAGLALPFTMALTVTVSAVALVAAAVVAWRHATRWLSDFASDLRSAVAHLRHGPLVQLVIVALVVAYALALAGPAMTYPPSGDAEAFYLAYPKFIASGERLVPFRGAYETMSSIGLVGEVHFAALMLMAAPAAAKLFAWLTGVAAVVMLVEIGRLAGLRASGRIMLGAMAFTSTALSLHLFSGKVDLFAAALALAAVYLLLLPGGHLSFRRNARIAGLAAGLACVAKLSYAVGFAPGVAFLVAARGRMGKWRTRATIRALLTVGVAAALAAVPHLIKNAVFFGEPLAPYFTSSPSLKWHESNDSWYPPEATRWIVLTYPLALVFGRYPMQEGTVSFLWIAFLPWVLLLWRGLRHDRSALAAGAAGLVAVLFWLALRPSVLAPRYFLASLLLMFVPVALAFERMIADPRVPKIARAAAVAVVVATLLIRFNPSHKGWLLRADGALRVAPTAEARFLGSYLRGQLPSCHRASPNCEGLGSVNAAAATGDRVYLEMYATYFLRPDLMQCRNTGAEMREFGNAGDRAPLWEMLASRGFRYVVIDTGVFAAFARRLDASPRPAWLDAETVPAAAPLRILRLRDRRDVPAANGACELPHSRT